MNVKTLALPLLVIALPACDFSHKTTEAPPPPTLRSYLVPVGHEQAAVDVLTRLFAAKESPARVSSAEDGRIVVLAPEALQRGVAEYLKALEGKPAAPRPSVEMSYWIVLGKPGAVEQTQRHGPVARALDAIVKTHGPMGFQVLETLSVITQSDEHSSAQGLYAQVENTVSVVGDQVVANVQVDPVGPSQLHTRLGMPSNQFVVVGEGAYEVRPGDLGYAGTRNEADRRRLFYIVRAVVQNAPAP